MKAPVATDCRAGYDCYDLDGDTVTECAPLCEVDADCLDDTLGYRCDPATSRCVDCLVDGDCVSGRCVEGRCGA